MNLQALGDKLQRYRIQLQRTVDEVAAFTAINVERLSSIEKGALSLPETRCSSCRLLSMRLQILYFKRAGRPI